MNFFGKLLTGLIAFAAIAVMVASMLVYATHRNWKQDFDTAKKQLTDAQARNQELQSQKDSLESRLNAEVEFARQEASKLTVERDQLLTDNEQIRTQIEGLTQQNRESTAAVAATQANNQKLSDDVGALRGEIRTNQSQRDRAFAISVQSTDELHQTKNELDTLRDRNTQLAQEIGNKIRVMEDSGIDPDTDPGAVMPRVRGVVSKVQSSDGNQFIEITIGSDDGLKPRHTVEIFRGDRYLGRAEILKTDPDRAVGQILRQFQQGQIEEGDDVATRFRIG